MFRLPIRSFSSARFCLRRHRCHEYLDDLALKPPQKRSAQDNALLFLALYQPIESEISAGSLNDDIRRKCESIKERYLHAVGNQEKGENCAKLLLEIQKVADEWLKKTS